MPGVIVHRGLPLRVDFDARGVTFWPLLAKPVFIAWPEMDFVCLTPAMERQPEGWREKTYTFLPKGFRSTLETSGHLYVELVVKDRRPLLARTEGAWTRRWLASRLRPMGDAMDALKVDQSLVGLDVYRHRLNAPLDELLDLLARQCRFDLVVHDF
ncbi:hypothetical protein HPP05_28735 [Corallococcus exiguus]|uniref:hypothetical protein n=1 Tax=Corallococcus TaxID=83461 RepID=UPI000EC9C60E|nr:MULTISPECIES: hypothetical protein [Corallococcus]NPC73749.1 hypothetical protein [Corallococcus exiguus]RKI00235.1 hypothetical protein D7Y04_17580 [Corallococcus sp. AB038B]